MTASARKLHSLAGQDPGILRNERGSRDWAILQRTQWKCQSGSAIIAHMEDRGTPAWLLWAREIQALSQTGLHYSQDHFNTERYLRLTEIAAEMTSLHTPLDKTKILESFLLEPGYATPKVDVRGAVIQEGKILLVQERSDGAWCMPGGWADVGKAPSAMVEREVREESGFSVKTSRVIGVYDANRGGRPRNFYHAYKLVFLCEMQSGTATPSSETQAVDFFPFDELPPLSLERTSQRHLDDVAAYLKDPDRQVYFD